MSLEIPPISETDTVGAIPVTEAVFGQAFNEPLIHQIVVAFMAGTRSGTKKQKNRADVSGGGSKPWRQKSTGRARAGTSRSPLWRSGGVTFAARPRDYSQKINKKMYRAGIRSIFSELLRQKRLFVSENIIPSEPKTKLLAGTLKECGTENILIVTDAPEKNLELSSRNISRISICTTNHLDPVSLVAAAKVIVTKHAISKIEEQLA